MCHYLLVPGKPMTVAGITNRIDNMISILDFSSPVYIQLPHAHEHVQTERDENWPSSNLLIICC